jgi:hypothetical protein
MWSEQPTPPDVAWDGYEDEPLPRVITAVNRVQGASNMSNTPAVLSGLTLGEPAIVCFVQKCQYSSPALGCPNPPAGWVLKSDEAVGDGTHRVGVYTTAAAQSLSPAFDFSQPNGGEVGLMGISVVGGGGGSLVFDRGDPIAGTPRVQWKVPPGSWSIRSQVALMTNTGSSWTPNDPRLTGFPAWFGGLVGVYQYPSPTTLESTSQGSPAGVIDTASTWDTSGGGIQGQAMGVSFAIGME